MENIMYKCVLCNNDKPINDYYIRKKGNFRHKKCKECFIKKVLEKKKTSEDDDPKERKPYTYTKGHSANRKSDFYKLDLIKQEQILKMLNTNENVKGISRENNIAYNTLISFKKKFFQK